MASVLSPPQITFWNSYGKPINATQCKALKTLLLALGATTAKIHKGIVIARFPSWKDLEKTNKDVLTPLSILFSQDGIESVYGKLQ